MVQDSPTQMGLISSDKMVSLSTTFVVLAALCWGLSGGIGGILTDQGWDPVVVSFYRGAIGLLFVLVWLALRPRGSGLANPRLWFWSAIGGRRWQLCILFRQYRGGQCRGCCDPDVLCAGFRLSRVIHTKT